MLFGLLTFLSTIVICATLQVHHPPHTSPSRVRTIPFNDFLGPQSLRLDHNITNATLVWFDFSSVPSAFDDDLCQSLSGHPSILVADSASFRLRLRAEQRLAQLAQDCGAKAIIRILVPEFGSSPWVGIHATSRDGDCCQQSPLTIHIPVGQAWRSDLEPHKENAKKNNTPIFASLHTLDENRWKSQVYESSIFRPLFMMFLPVLNAVAVVYGIFALRAQQKVSRMVRRNDNLRMSFHHVSWKEKMMTKIPSTVQVAILLEMSVALIRTIYCLFGPLEFNSFFTWEQHMFLANISTPFEIFVITISVFTFQSVGGLKRIKGHAGKENFLLISGIAVFVGGCEIAAGVLRARRKATGIVFRATIGMSACFMLIASIIFLVFGSKFLNKLHCSQRLGRSRISHKDRAKRKFTVFIMLGAAAHLVALAAFVIAVVFSDEFFTPYVWACSFFSYYFAFTMSSIFHIAAFVPSRAARRRLTNGSIQSEEISYYYIQKVFGRKLSNTNFHIRKNRRSCEVSGQVLEQVVEVIEDENGEGEGELQVAPASDIAGVVYGHHKHSAPASMEIQLGVQSPEMPQARHPNVGALDTSIAQQGANHLKIYSLRKGGSNGSSDGSPTKKHFFPALPRWSSRKSDDEPMSPDRRETICEGSVNDQRRRALMYAAGLQEEELVNVGKLGVGCRESVGSNTISEGLTGRTAISGQTATTSVSRDTPNGVTGTPLDDADVLEYPDLSILDEHFGPADGRVFTPEEIVDDEPGGATKAQHEHSKLSNTKRRSFNKLRQRYQEGDNKERQSWNAATSGYSPFNRGNNLRRTTSAEGRTTPARRKKLFSMWHKTANGGAGKRKGTVDDLAMEFAPIDAIVM